MDPAQVTYEDYVAMCGCPPVMGIDGMLAHYKITMAQWSQIAANWNNIIATNPKYVQHSMRVEQEAARIRAGGAPRPISAGDPPAGAPGLAPDGIPPPQESSLHAVSGGMPGAVPPRPYGASPLAVSGGMPGAMPPGYGPPPPGGYGPPPNPPPLVPPPNYSAPPPPPPGYGAPPPPGYTQPSPQGYPPAPPPPPPGYPPPGYPPQQQQQAWPQQQMPQQQMPQQQMPQQPMGYPQQPGYNQQAAKLGNDVGNAFSAIGSAFGSVVSSVVGTFVNGSPVLVQWSDGQRYPATVLCSNAGQVQVAFPDGRQVWVPSQYVVAR